TLGPAGWLNEKSYPPGKAKHPVSGVSFFEAQAFARWCMRTQPGDWSLPPEDVWEYAARSEAGLIYPWGDAFDSTKCNSAEAGINGTTEVTRYESGESPIGCCDMSGNVWEHVIATDTGDDWCVMRGGSYLNTHSEVRTYLRLTRV